VTGNQRPVNPAPAAVSARERAGVTIKGRRPDTTALRSNQTAGRCERPRPPSHTWSPRTREASFACRSQLRRPPDPALDTRGGSALLFRARTASFERFPASASRRTRASPVACAGFRSGRRAKVLAVAAVALASVGKPGVAPTRPSPSRYPTTRPPLIRISSCIARRFGTVTQETPLAALDAAAAPKRRGEATPKKGAVSDAPRSRASCGSLLRRRRSPSSSTSPLTARIVWP